MPSASTLCVPNGTHQFFFFFFFLDKKLVSNIMFLTTPVPLPSILTLPSTQKTLSNPFLIPHVPFPRPCSLAFALLPWCEFKAGRPEEDGYVSYTLEPGCLEMSSFHPDAALRFLSLYISSQDRMIAFLDIRCGLALISRRDLRLWIWQWSILPVSPFCEHFEPCTCSQVSIVHF
jgi:hypothetical protein